MTQYNTLNVKLSNSQLNKSKSSIRSGTEVTLNISSNLIVSSNDETNLPHKLLLTNTKVSKICKAFANGSSANIKFSKNFLSKIVKLGGFIFGPPYMFNLPNEGLISLVSSIARESKSMGAKKLHILFIIFIVL